MLRIIEEIKSEIACFTYNKKYKVLFGLLFLTVGLILISVFNVPLLFGNFKVFPGGGLQIFICYFFTLFFFFVTGFITSFLYGSREKDKSLAKKAMTDLIIAYALRLFWIILFIGYSSFLITFLFIAASATFLVFALMCTRKISLFVSLIEIIILIEEAAVILLNIKMIAVN